MIDRRFYYWLSTLRERYRKAADYSRTRIAESQSQIKKANCVLKAYWCRNGQWGDDEETSVHDTDVDQPSVI